VALLQKMTCNLRHLMGLRLRHSATTLCVNMMMSENMMMCEHDEERRSNIRAIFISALWQFPLKLLPPKSTKSRREMWATRISWYLVEQIQMEILVISQYEFNYWFQNKFSTNNCTARYLRVCFSVWARLLGFVDTRIMRPRNPIFPLVAKSDVSTRCAMWDRTSTHNISYRRLHTPSHTHTISYTHHLIYTPSHTHTIISYSLHTTSQTHVYTHHVIHTPSHTVDTQRLIQSHTVSYSLIQSTHSVSYSLIQSHTVDTQRLIQSHTVSYSRHTASHTVYTQRLIQTPDLRSDVSLNETSILKSYVDVWTSAFWNRTLMSGHRPRWRQPESILPHVAIFWRLRVVLKGEFGCPRFVLQVKFGFWDS